MDGKGSGEDFFSGTFFILLKATDTAELNGNNCHFSHLTRGMEILIIN